MQYKWINNVANMSPEYTIIYLNKNWNLTLKQLITIE